MAVELLLEVQRSVASPNDEWPVAVAAVIGLKNLSGSTQPFSGYAFWAVMNPCGPKLA